MDRRIPPHAIDIEKALLGLVLSNNELAMRIVGEFPTGDFYDHKHELIYETVCNMVTDNDPVDLITVNQRLTDDGLIDEVGGTYYLTELTDNFSSSTNAEYYIRILKEHSMARKSIIHLTDSLVKMYDTSIDVFDKLNEVQQNLYEVEDGVQGSGLIPLGYSVQESYQYYKEIDGTPGGITGVPTGYERVDKITGGWQKGNLVIIAARPSMGKSSFMLGAARNSAMDHTKTTGIFSFEMNGRSLANRMICSEARVDISRARAGILTHDEWDRMEIAKERLKEIPIIIDDSHDANLPSVLSKIRRMVQDGVEQIYIDYVQLMYNNDLRKSGNREQEISSISRSLKKAAVVYNIPIIGLSQLSRAVESRGGNKRPQLSDLRESGAIEQDADVVAFIYRPERYGIEVDENGNSTEGLGHVLFEKHRDGPLGVATLAFVQQYAKFENLVGEEYYGKQLPKWNSEEQGGGNQGEFDWD